MCRRFDENEKQDVCHVDFAQIGFRPKVLGTYRKVASSNTYVSCRSACMLFQIACEGDFLSLCTVVYCDMKVGFFNYKIVV